MKSQFQSKYHRLLWYLLTILCLAFGAFCLLLTLLLPEYVSVASAQSSVEKFNNSQDTYTLTYHIERAQIPQLYYQDLTLKITAKEFSSATATADRATGERETIPYTYDASAQQFILTTDAITVNLVLSGVTNLDGLGQIEKAALKDDKSFAWSHGMDDNFSLESQIDVLEELGWRGTLFLIGNILEDELNDDGFLDTPYLQEKLSAGWSLGNHTWDHNCDSATITEQTVLDGYDRLRQIVDTSSVPEYQLIGFAAPCFISEYQPIILSHRDNSVTEVQFNESGGGIPLVVDVGVTDDLMDPDNPGQIVATAFDYDSPIGRSVQIEAGDVAGEMAMHDFMARMYAEQGLHLWHNTLAHGDSSTGADSNSGRLATIAAYVQNTYGSNGTNQVWVAPSDEIYSYLLVRDRSVVSLLTELPSSPHTVFLPTIQKP